MRPKCSYGWILFPYCLLWIGIHIQLVIVTIYAMETEKQLWMWPFVIFAALKFFVVGFITTVTFTLGSFSTDYFLEIYGQDHEENWLFRWGIVFRIKCFVLLFGAFLFWRLAIIYTTKKYYEEQENGSAYTEVETLVESV